MFLRQSILSFALLAAVSGCRLLRPVNPNQPAAPAAAKPAPSRDAAKPGTPVAKAAPKAVSAKEARAGLTDPHIGAMVLALNNTDLSYARLALAPRELPDPTTGGRESRARAERPDVKEFAQRMLTDHSAVNGLLNDLLNKLNMTPVENEASLDMRDESANRRDAMRDLIGYAFDSTYIENEVAYHQKYLASVDSLMLPAARNAELKSLLTTVRPAVAAHLAHAEQVRANVLTKQ